MVDDVKDNRLVIAAFLKQTSHHIEMAVNGEKAVKAFKSRGFDLVLMDVMMPVLDGFGAIKIMRDWEKQQGYPPTPIVALTANVMAEDIDKTLAAGFDLHLAKPIRKAYLLEVVARFYPQTYSDSTPDTTTAKIESKASGAQTGQKQSGPEDCLTLDDRVLNIFKKEIGSNGEKLMQDFIKRLPFWVDEMQTAIDTEDRRKIYNAAHKLKGTGRQYGAMKLAHYCENLENMTKDGNISEIPQLLAGIQGEIKQVRELFKQFKWESSG